MSILLGVIMLFALLSALLAAGQAIAISRLAVAAGPSWHEWLFGWWRFERVASWAGLSGEVQAAIYKRAVIACLGFLILGLILSGWVVNQRQAAEPAATSALINDWRVLPAAQFAEQFEIRRVAPMPGTTILES
ncbi:hypothetical protein [Devosia sp.]|uniref:hypothetical protein n=1 Tax=Devosia sp. TaxID=1871048 RepID=UPI001B12FA11|nr:hypothetical protein [Devosia sp.]MBO9587930.1 hypothetical protein [Devosia sp.]